MILLANNNKGASMKRLLIAAILSMIFLVAGCFDVYLLENVSTEDASDVSYVDLEDVGKAEEASGDSEETAEEAAPEEAVEETEGDVLKSSQIVKREGELVELKLQGTDPDGDPIFYKFSQPLDENGKWQTQEGDKGIYEVDITASDGKIETTKTIQIVIKERNKAPVLNRIDDITVVIGGNVKLKPTATDPNPEDELQFSYAGWMTSDAYKTTEEDIGKHTVTVIVSDEEFTDSKTITITVLPNNAPPVIKFKDTVEVNEGETIVLNPEVSDPDGDEVAVTYSGWMTSNTQATKFEDAGEYVVTIHASDGELESTKDVKVVVNNRNRAPEFDIIIS